MQPSLGLNVAYHFIVTPNGKVWKTRSENDVGHHAGNWEINQASLAICLVGHFEKNEPTRQQLSSLNTLVKRIQRKYRIEKVIPHSQSNETLCCGWKLKRKIMDFPWGEKYFK